MNSASEKPQVLAIVFSPANIICALGATLFRHDGRAGLILGVCDWPGMTPDENRDRLDVFRRMTSRIPFVEKVVPLTDAMVAWAAQLRSAGDIASEVKGWIGHDIDEIQYSHDLLGAIYQLTAMAWPRARRVSFGDGFGHIAGKEDYLALQRADEGEQAAQDAKRAYRRLRLRNRVKFELSRFGLLRPPAPDDILFAPHEYRLYLPLSDFGYIPDATKLNVVPRVLFFTVVDLIRDSTEAADYERKLLARVGDRPAIFMATENYVEAGLMPIEQEIEMWLDMLAPYLANNPLIVVKQHPGERQQRWRLLAERLAGRADVCEFSPAHQRLPLEAFTGLVERFEFVTSAFLRVSLNYLHGAAIPNPMTDTIVEKYFPLWFQPKMKKIAWQQDAYIAALARWDGKGMLYSKGGFA